MAPLYNSQVAAGQLLGRDSPQQGIVSRGDIGKASVKWKVLM